MIFVHFDVLALPGEQFIRRQPSREGRRLWNTLFDQYKGQMVVLADEATDLTLIQAWLKTEGYKPSLIHIADSFCRAGRTSRSEAVWHMHSTIGKPHWYIDTDPACCAEVLKMGIPTLLVAVPAFGRPEWHDKEDIRAWDLVVEELNAQALKKQEKAWKDDA